MSERKFTKALGKPGMAAQLRETVSQVVRETTVHTKPALVEPLDFETFVLKNKTVLQNDPQRELLLYPTDDVSQVVLPRKYRTVGSNVPLENELEGCGLFIKECVKSYSSNWNIIHYKYSAYSGSYLNLPKVLKYEDLNDEVYEVDSDVDQLEALCGESAVSKQGVLLGGQEAEGGASQASSSDALFAARPRASRSSSLSPSIFPHMGPRSFKRRYCFLRREPDGTHVLRLYKDENRSEVKATIVVDFCSAVVQNPAKGNLCFEILSPAGQSMTLAAESETEMNDWISKLKSVISRKRIKPEEQEMEGKKESPVSKNMPGSQPTLDSLRIRYSRETDISIAAARKENRRGLFIVHPFGVAKDTEIKSGAIDEEESIEPYSEHFGKRIVVQCKGLRFRLRASPTSQGTDDQQVEPYFTSLALYDVKQGRKISENFYFDLNGDEVADMLPSLDDKLDENGSPIWRSGAVPDSWALSARKAILSITDSHAEVYLVVKVEKVLQGGIVPASEPYVRCLRGNEPLRAPPRLLRTVQSFCKRLGYYRMPFAWSARPLFSSHNQLNTSAEFSPIYRQEVGKLSDEDLIKILADFKKPEKMSRWTVIPGTIDITLENFTDLLPNSLTSSMIPLKPFPAPPMEAATIEIAEFDPPSSSPHPHTTFLHNAYIYPRSLRFESQRMFARARNIACTVEIRDSDKAGAQPLKCIYSQAGCRRTSLWTRRVTCPVIHHSTNPSWYEEIKVRLPVCQLPSHHLLFTFHHIPCEAPRRRGTSEGGGDVNGSSVASTSSCSEGIVPLGSCVGYSWLPLLNASGMEEHSVPVAATLPPGYLSILPSSASPTSTSSDIVWVDGRKPIFNVMVRVTSTISSSDKLLSGLFELAEGLPEKQHPDACKILREAQGISIPVVVMFLPTLFNQLFRLLLLVAHPQTAESNESSSEFGLAVLRLIVHLVHELYQAGKSKALEAYLKYVFLGPAMTGSEVEPIPVGSGSPLSAHSLPPTVHEELSRHLPTLLRPANTDPFVVNHFMLHSNIFFGAMVKSMAQHLLSSGRIKMHRNERFSSDYLYRIQNLLQVLCPLVTQKYAEMPDETAELNRSIAFFLKRCLSFMDRGYVFRLINGYMGRFSPGDSPALCAYKFTFLQILCSHEHYVALNLPLDSAILYATSRGSTSSSAGRIASALDDESEDTPSEALPSDEFCRHHFLAGLLQREVRASLLESHQVRSTALSVFRQLLTKHELDDRYQTKGRLSRIAALYEPWLSIILENVARLEDRDPDAKSPAAKRDHLTNGIFQSDDPINKYFQQSSPLDSPLLAAISRRADSRVNGFPQGDSLPSADTTDSSIPPVDYCGSNHGILRISSIGGHSRSPSGLVHYDSLSSTELHDMLLCFLFVVKHLGEEKLVAWWSRLSENELLHFFHILEICLHHFRYQGRRNIVARSRTDLSSHAEREVGGRAMTLPARVQPPTEASLSRIEFDGGMRRGGGSGGVGGITFRSDSSTASTGKGDPIYQALLEANVATEVGLVVLDALGLFSSHGGCTGTGLPPIDGPILRAVFAVHLSFLRVGQSETLMSHVFAALRAFADNFSRAIFKGSASICGQLCHELLRCCGSRLSTTRHEACTLLYLLMRGNYKSASGKGMMRVHTQVMVAVSRMLGAGIATLDSARLKDSLSLIDELASRDHSVKGTGFPAEVADLTQRVRTVLATMARMREHSLHDPEMLADMQHSLASSYASTPQLRHAWLHSMALSQKHDKNHSEGAMCQLHIAALIAEFLKQHKLLPWGADVFASLSSNIPLDEMGPEPDSGSTDSQYSEDTLLAQVETCADWIWMAERYELLGPLYRLILPIYEKKQQYDCLARAYSILARSCSKIVEVERSGRRLLGTYYRVAFYGKASPCEGQFVEYIYREPKVTPLAEISERLRQQHSDRHGADAVRLVMESQKLDPDTLDQNLAYIQVTHVLPYFEDASHEGVSRVTNFDRNHDVRHFVFETPFVEGGGGTRSEEFHLQWKRRTILTTEYAFPYMKKRILVVDRREENLSPIEVALDEMRCRVAELQEVVSSSPTDTKKLQLRLQGSVCVQVNAGPLAYAKAFLDPSKVQGGMFPEERVEQLREVFVEFLKVCNAALKLNAGLVSADRFEYQKVLSDNYKQLVDDLNRLTGGFVSSSSGYESPIPASIEERESGDVRKRNSRLLFGMIGGASFGSSTA